MQWSEIFKMKPRIMMQLLKLFIELITEFPKLWESKRKYRQDICIPFRIFNTEILRECRILGNDTFLYTDTQPQNVSRMSQKPESFKKFISIKYVKQVVSIYLSISMENKINIKLLSILNLKATSL